MLKVKFVEASATADTINNLMKAMEKEEEISDFAHVELSGEKIAIWYEVKGK